MAYLAPARAADAASFPDGEVGKVVVQDEFFLAGSTSIGIKFLRVFACAQGAEGDSLGFAALEQGRTMGARQYSHLAVDGADLFKAAPVQAFVVVHDQAADCFLLDVVKSVFGHKLGYFLLAELFSQLFADFIRQRRDRRFASQLLGRE